MHIEFLVEEPSAEAALSNLIPIICGADVTFAVHAFQGKPDLLKHLPQRLQGYRTWLPADWRIVVLIDADADDCRHLKAQMEEAANRAGLVTKTTARGSRFQVLNRLAVEELEAWFFGDIQALHAAYPRIRTSLAERRGFRQPDAIAGGTWEALVRELARAGYGFAGKMAVARAISAHMQPERNRSHSFQVFRTGLSEMLSENAGAGE